MLYALVVTLVAAQDTTVPPATGHLAHGALFRLLDRVDPRFATALHKHDDPGANCGSVRSGTC